VAKRFWTLPAHIYLPLYGAYGVPAMAWYDNVKPLMFEMSVPQFFITAPRVLTRASDSEEGATTESLQKTECVLPNARQDHIKKPVIPIDMKKGLVKVPNICEKENI
jgi:hypothetical protein